MKPRAKNKFHRRRPTYIYYLYGRFAAGGNLYATTIHVLVSAVVKIARVMRLPPGLELFRGLGGRMDLPDSFRRADANGRRGYAEFGFPPAEPRWRAGTRQKEEQAGGRRSPDPKAVAGNGQGP